MKANDELERRVAERTEELRQANEALRADITECKFREEEDELTSRLMALVNTPGDLRKRMSDLTANLQGWSGCEAVGICLRAGDDCPYYKSCGFPPTFIQAENRLCTYGPSGEILRDGAGNPVPERMCGKIPCGRLDSARPFFIANGSFWSDNTTALLIGAAEADHQARTRNRCNGEGYESVALIPLCTDDRFFGLLQFNDHRPDRFTPDMIAHLERMAAKLAIALKRHQTEKALKESEEKYRSLATSVDSMYLVDRDLTYLFMNEGCRIRFGLPLGKIIGRRYCEFHSEEDSTEFSHCIREVCETGKPVIQEHKSERDGGYFLRTFTPIMDWSAVGKISKVVIVSKDITERKRVEMELIETVQQLQETRDMLIQFEKHAAIGRLAAGVAHGILNPASIISSRLQFLEEENLSEPARENVKISREQLQRIVKISRALLQSSTKRPRVLVGGDLRRVIEVGLQMTGQRIKEADVEISYDPPSEVIPVKMEMDRVVKVMVNLILNACDAVSDNYPKRIIIDAYCPEVSSTRPSARLIVADNGHGILEGEFDKIFEPFFTRKDPDKGTGLGLSVSKGIIQEHGGTIHAENNHMGGASFIIELPLDQP